DAFEKVIGSAARGFLRQGFKDVVLLGDHGGYQKNLRRVAERLNREGTRSGGRVHAIEEYYDAMANAYPALLARQGHSQAEIGTHAGLADTSLALAIDPSLARKDRLAEKAGAPQGV